MLPRRRSAEALGALGLLSPRGRISADLVRKLRQVQGMLPWLLKPVAAARSSPFTAIEFGCGKAYLSFFLASAFRDLQIGSATIIGVDHDPAVIERCCRARDALAWHELQFVVSPCERFVISPAPLLVTSLHACDVATDHVLAAGIHLGAEHIVAAPCCYFTVQRELRERAHRHNLGYVSRAFPLLGSRLSEFATDAMRCLALRAHGYDVQVREFVSGTATPKNIVLIARLAGIRGGRAATELQRIEQHFRLQCEVLLSLHRLRGAAAHAQATRRVAPVTGDPVHESE